jgi:hypothetical protein
MEEYSDLTIRRKLSIELICCVLPRLGKGTFFMKVIWKGLQFPLNRSTQHINLATERKIVQIKSIE